MWFYGIVIGAATFLIIGALHPVVIKSEYHFGVKVWPAFLVVGLACLVLSAVVPWPALSAILGVTGFSFLWGIHELFAQRARVKRDWYPAHPHRKHLYHKTDDENRGPQSGPRGSHDEGGER